MKMDKIDFKKLGKYFKISGLISSIGLGFFGGILLGNVLVNNVDAKSKYDFEEYSNPITIEEESNVYRIDYVTITSNIIVDEETGVNYIVFTSTTKFGKDASLEVLMFQNNY